MKKLLMVLSATSIMALAACSEVEDVSTGSTGNSVETKQEAKKEPKKAEGKKIDASKESVEAKGLKVGLGEIKITKDKISVGINIENTSDQVLSFYPDQGQMVIGDMQLKSNFMMNDGTVDGDIQPGVKQDAVYVYPAPKGKAIDVKAVEDIKLFFGNVNGEDYMNAEKVDFAVKVK